MTTAREETPDEKRWTELWSMTYDLEREIDAIIKERFKNYPVLWRTMGVMGILEHLAEGARWSVVLPPAPMQEDSSD